MKEEWRQRKKRGMKGAKRMVARMKEEDGEGGKRKILGGRWKE